MFAKSAVVVAKFAAARFAVAKFAAAAEMLVALVVICMIVVDIVGFAVAVGFVVLVFGFDFGLHRKNLVGGREREKIRTRIGTMRTTANTGGQARIVPNRSHMRL